MVLQCFCMMEEIQGSWGLNEIENITRSGFSFFSTFFKETSLGIALARTIAESTIEELKSLLRRKSLIQNVWVLQIWYSPSKIYPLLDSCSKNVLASRIASCARVLEHWEIRRSGGAIYITNLAQNVYGRGGEGRILKKWKPITLN